MQDERLVGYARATTDTVDLLLYTLRDLYLRWWAMPYSKALYKSGLKDFVTKLGRASAVGHAHHHAPVSLLVSTYVQLQVPSPVGGVAVSHHCVQGMVYRTSICVGHWRAWPQWAASAGEGCTCT